MALRTAEYKQSLRKPTLLRFNQISLIKAVHIPCSHGAPYTLVFTNVVAKSLKDMIAGLYVINRIAKIGNERKQSQKL